MTYSYPLIKVAQHNRRRSGQKTQTQVRQINRHKKRKREIQGKSTKNLTTHDKRQILSHQTYDSRRQLVREGRAVGRAGALTMLRNGAEERSVKIPAGDVEVLLVAILVRPRHVLVGDTLAESHVPPLPRRLGKPVSVMLHNALLLQLQQYTTRLKKNSAAAVYINSKRETARQRAVSKRCIAG